MFQAQTAKQALKDSIAAALAGQEQEMTLPAVESQIRALQERQMELFQLAVSAGVECTDYDEELQQVNMAKTRLLAKKAELERQGRTAAEFDRRMEQLGSEIDKASSAISDFDDITVRQLISNIKVLGKDRILVRFKDGTEIEQTIEDSRKVRAS